MKHDANVTQEDVPQDEIDFRNWMKEFVYVGDVSTPLDSGVQLKVFFKKSI